MRKQIANMVRKLVTDNFIATWIEIVTVWSVSLTGKWRLQAEKLLCRNTSYGTLISYIFAARRYASPEFAVIVCPSVRPSHAGILSKRMNGSSGFRHGGFLPPVLRCVIRKSGIFSKAVNLLGLLKLSVKKVENRSTFSKVIRHRIAACVFNVYLTHSAFDVSFVTESKMQKHNAIKTF